jgi:hypothetical protein
VDTVRPKSASAMREPRSRSESSAVSYAADRVRDSAASDSRFRTWGGRMHWNGW